MALPVRPRQQKIVQKVSNSRYVHNGLGRQNRTVRRFYFTITVEPGYDINGAINLETLDCLGPTQQKKIVGPSLVGLNGSLPLNP
jgi:hypothetical protein